MEDRRAHRLRRVGLLVGSFLVLLAATAFGLVNAIQAPISARNADAVLPKASYSHGTTSSEEAACKSEERTLRTFPITTSTLKKDVFAENAVTVDNPDALVPAPPQPSSGYWRSWADTYFYAQMSLNAVDLDTGRATLGFGVTPGGGQNRRSGPPLPQDSSFALDVLTIGGLASIPISSAVNQFKGLGVASLNVPLTGDPSAYPFDAYQTKIFDILVVVTVPGHGSADFEADISNVFSAQNVHADVTLAAGSQLTFPDRNACRIPLRLIVGRSIGRVQIWLMLMALLPLAFVPLVYVAVRKRGVGDGAALAALAVGLVAILPLRAVLVPPTVPAPTTIDFILGADMTLLLLVFVLGKLISSMRNPSGKGSANNQVPVAGTPPGEDPESATSPQDRPAQ